MSKVSISRLSRYAANPVEYRRSGGGIVSKKAVDIGNKGHINAGRAKSESTSVSVRIIALVIIGAAVLIWIW